MNKAVIFCVLSAIFASYCKNPPDLSHQLKDNFSDRLHKIDSSIILVDFNILRIDTIYEKQINIFDDSMYRMELRRVQTQFDDATKAKKMDSIEFYNGEVEYMKTQLDSYRRSIITADIRKPQGVLTICQYQISRGDKIRRDTVLYIFDNNMRIIFPDGIDSTIQRSYRQIR